MKRLLRNQIRYLSALRAAWASQKKSDRLQAVLSDRDEQIKDLAQEVERLKAQIEVYQVQEEMTAKVLQALSSRVDETIAVCEGRIANGEKG